MEGSGHCLIWGNVLEFAETYLLEPSDFHKVSFGKLKELFQDAGSLMEYAKRTPSESSSVAEQGRLDAELFL
jgi:hypothetical protein